MTNLQEFLAATNPKDPNSSLRLQLSLIPSTNGVVLTWPASPSRFYRVQFKNDLNAPLWFDADGVPSIVSGQGFFVIPADQPARYYRIAAND